MRRESAIFAATRAVAANVVRIPGKSNAQGLHEGTIKNQRPSD
jgi:hypothetical protein